MTILFDTTPIKQTLQTHLQQATHSIEIAMAWFTDTALAAALRAAVKRGVRVQTPHNALGAIYREALLMPN